VAALLCIWRTGLDQDQQLDMVGRQNSPEHWLRFGRVSAKSQLSQNNPRRGNPAWCLGITLYSRYNDRVSDPRDGIQEKLQRAKETIGNLDAEIARFLSEHPGGGFSKDKQKAMDEWLDFHSRRKIPPRFPIIAGEIIHHLRSCLDHVAWMLSCDTYRREHETLIAFPVCIRGDKKELSRYAGQVRGITNLDALKLIDDAQPYHGASPLDDPLAIIHKLDRVDKHHEVVLVVRSFNMGISIPRSILTTFILGASHMDEEAFANHFASKIEVKLSGCIAFAEFGERKNQPIIPALKTLSDAVRDLVGQFSQL
jgi:hypothetical protein